MLRDSALSCPYLCVPAFYEETWDTFMNLCSYRRSCLASPGRGAAP